MAYQNIAEAGQGSPKPAFSYHSQLGEDKIIHGFLDRMSIANGYFVEFGAWDGKYMSNTYFLYELGWSGCYIEGDPRRMHQLEKNCPDARARKVCAFVRTEGESSLDNILTANGAPEVDLLSIDIDSDDYAVWKSLSKFRPRVVVIEYNPSIPFDTQYVNPPGANHGNSARSLAELGEARDYSLVAGTLFNLIFIPRELAEKHGIPSVTLQSIRDATNAGRYFFAFDGTLVQAENGRHNDSYGDLLIVPWADCPVPQPLPRGLRQFRSGWGPVQVLRAGYAFFWSFLRSPAITLKYLRKRVAQKFSR